MGTHMSHSKLESENTAKHQHAIEQMVLEEPDFLRGVSAAPTLAFLQTSAPGRLLQ